jgi:hypothetical protein
VDECTAGHNLFRERKLAIAQSTRHSRTRNPSPYATCPVNMALTASTSVFAGKAVATQSTQIRSAKRASVVVKASAQSNKVRAGSIGRGRDTGTRYGVASDVCSRGVTRRGGLCSRRLSSPLLRLRRRRRPRKKAVLV